MTNNDIKLAIISDNPTLLCSSEILSHADTLSTSDFNFNNSYDLVIYDSEDEKLLYALIGKGYNLLVESEKVSPSVMHCLEERRIRSFEKPISDNDIYSAASISSSHIYDVCSVFTDEAVKKSESSLRAIFDASEDIIIMLDKSGHLLDFNFQFVKVMKAASVELLNNNIWDIPGFLNSVERRLMFENVFKTGKPAEFEDYNEGVWYNIHIRPVSLDNVSYERFVIFARDITERKEVQHQEKMNELRNKALAVLGQMYEADFEDILEYSLESAIEQTMSIGGYIASYDDGQDLFQLKAIKHPAEDFVEMCSGVDLDVNSFPYLSGLLREKEPLMNKKERYILPKPNGGFEEISEYGVYVPILAQGGLRLVLSVFGKNTEYSYADSLGLIHFMEGVWRLRERKETERTISLLNEELEKKVNLRTIQLRESEMRFRTAFESTVHGMLLLSLRGEIIEANESFAKMLGYSEDELEGESIFSLSGFDEAGRTMREYARLAAGDASQFEQVVNYITKDGGTVITTVNAAVIRDGNKPVNVVASVVNITEAELTRMERDGIFELSRDIIGITDFKGKIIFFNTAIEGLLEYDTTGWSGKYLENVLRLKDIAQLKKAYKVLRYREEVIDFESVHEVPDGRKIWLSWSFTYDRLNDRVYGAGRDVTDRKEYEESLKLAKEEAEKADRAKSEFLANISHEIRTPLNAVIGFSELLSSRVMDDKSRSYLNSIKTSGKSLLTLINDILDISKLESVNDEAVLAPASLKLLLDDLVKMFRYRAENSGVEIMYVIDKDVPESLLIDVARLRQVLLNLIGNAVKFTEEGEVVILASATLKADSRLDLAIGVKDTGIGIPSEEFIDIFQPFRQRAGQNINKYGGTGLGLSISSKLMDIMGGKIEVESEVGKGSTFTLKLPNIVISDTVVHEDVHGGVKYIFHPAKLLLVDDELSRKVMQEMLANTGISVTVAENLLSATHIAKESKPDVVIISDRMAGANSRHKAKKLFTSATDDKCKVIVLLSTPARAQDYADYDAMFIKPVTLSSVMHVLANFLEVKEKLVDDALEDNILKEQVLSVYDLKNDVDDTIRELINAFSGIVDFDYIDELISHLKGKGERENKQALMEAGERLEYLVDNLEIQNIKKMLVDLQEMVNS